MTSIEVRRFSDDDIPFGKMLTDAEGWHRTIADWKRLLALSPTGMFKARFSGKDVGIAGVIAYDKVAWIHSVIVLNEFRGKGIGGALMRACIDRVEGLNLPCIKLDSVKGFEGFYRGLGFVEEFESRRFLGDGRYSPCSAEHVRPSDLVDISAFDRSMTGLDRSSVLGAIFNDAPELAFCVRSAGELVGYVLARWGEERIQIGPCVVSDGDSSCAYRLISALLGSQPGQRFRMCVPGKNAAAVKLATDLGLESAQSSTRMYLGRKFEETSAAFAMVSAEKG